MNREQLLAELNKVAARAAELRGAETLDTVALDAAESIRTSLLNALAALDAATPAVSIVPAAAPATRSTVARKAIESGVFARALNGDKSFEAVIDISDVRDALDIFTDPNGASGSSPIVAPDYLTDIALKPVAPLTLLNYIPQSNTQSDTVVVFVETGFTDNTAPVARRAGSPADYTAYTESGITFTRLVQTVSKVGTVFRTDTSTLADQAQLASIIENRLVYGIKNNLIAQMVASTDTANGIPSLLVTGSGRAQSLTYEVVANNLNQTRINAIEAVRQGITAVQKTFTPAAYILASASFIEALSLATSTIGTYLFAQPTSTTQQLTLWGLPVVWCPQMVIADDSEWGGIAVGSSQYVSLVNRQQITVAASENVGTDFVEDAVRFRGSIRVALTNVRPEAFCVITGHLPA